MNAFEIEFDIKPNEFEIDLEKVIKQIEPSGEINITENGTYDVASYGVANINVSGDPIWEASYRSLLDNTLGANTTKLPSDLTSVGNYAFAYRTNLEITELPDTVSYIGQYAFRDCANMALNKLPSNLTKIGSRAFYFCYKNSFNKIPDTVSEIGVYAFGSNTSLERILYSNKCGIIPEGCFNGCSNLKYFECEEQVYAIDYASFKTSGLETLVIKRTTPPSLNASSLQNTPIASGNGYIYVPDEAINTYKTATNWSTYASQIKPISELNM